MNPFNSLLDGVLVAAGSFSIFPISARLAIVVHEYGHAFAGVCMGAKGFQISAGYREGWCKFEETSHNNTLHSQAGFSMVMSVAGFASNLVVGALASVLAVLSPLMWVSLFLGLFAAANFLTATDFLVKVPGSDRFLFEEAWTDFCQSCVVSDIATLEVAEPDPIHLVLQRAFEDFPSALARAEGYFPQSGSPLQLKRTL